MILTTIMVSVFKYFETKQKIMACFLFLENGKMAAQPNATLKRLIYYFGQMVIKGTNKRQFLYTF